MPEESAALFSKFSERKYAMPFGRYAGASEVEAPADEVLVGREGQRTYLIESLISTGRRGAFLVTGRRGAGKSSFVRYCIEEYKASVFRRFLRGNVGRSFWDRTFVALFGAALLVAALVVSELTQVLVPLTEKSHNLLPLLLIPVGIALLYPCVYAKLVFETVLLRVRWDFLRKGKEESSGAAMESQFAEITATALTLMIAAVCWFLPPFGAPALGVVAFAPLIGGIYLAVQAVSFQDAQFLDADKPWSQRLLLSLRRHKLPTLVLALFFLLLAAIAFSPRNFFAGAPEDVFQVEGGLGIGLLGLGCLLRGWHQRWRLARPKEDTAEASAETRAPKVDGTSTGTVAEARRQGGTWYLEAGFFLILGGIWAFCQALPFGTAPQRALEIGGLGIALLGVGCLAWGWHRNEKPEAEVVDQARRQALRRGGTWYLGTGSILILGATATLGFCQALSWPSQEGWALVALGLLTLGVLVVASRRDTVDRRFRPRPAVALAAKAVLAIVVSLQLAHPLLIRLPWVACEGDCLQRAQHWSFCPTQDWTPPGPVALRRVPGLHLKGKEEALEGKDQASAPASASVPLFASREDEIYWLCALLGLLGVFYFLEYEWVVRPYSRTRDDTALDPLPQSPWEDGEDECILARDRWRNYRRLAALTLPWVVYETWLPVLPVQVNLGFDRLGHREVIQAMLVGLRSRYHRFFLAWNSGFANLGRFVGICVLLVLVNLSSAAWFTLPSGLNDTKACASARAHNPPSSGQKQQADTNQKASTPQPPVEKQQADAAQKASTPQPTDEKQQADEDSKLPPPPPIVSLLCRVGETWFQIAYFQLVPKSLGDLVEQRAAARPLLLDLIPSSQGSKPDSSSSQGSKPDSSSSQRSRPDFRLYHLLLLASLIFVGRWFLRRVPLLPYKENLRRIDDMLDSLSQRTKETVSRNVWGPARWVYNFVAEEKIRETERDPVDPRSVELAFLQILGDIQKGGFRMPGAARHHLTMPAPEITFVFDELDKLGTRVDPESAAHAANGREEEQALHRERQRSVQLRALLSDLKNILASAPARFIFVGGRDLHDEWLADQTARLPLLTSIFNAEVYLPSLMTDHSSRPWREPALHSRVHEYLRYQFGKADLLYRRSMRKRWRPSLALPVEALSHDRFVPVQTPDNPESERSLPELPRIIDCATGRPLGAEGEGEALQQHFVLFLTHRSMGNPKKLKELLESFVRPAGRELEPDARWKVPCRHLLCFGDTEIFRIQLLVDIYRHLALAFEERMVQRDDKLATSIFFLTDFLFKFHTRAFSWSNLERVDDLAHIHRLPDLRDVQEEIVDHFSERFLHRVLNGMYAFRFRSDIAREVEYLSRRSPAEMAAFNFALDESQSLKADYLTALKGKEGENPDQVAALGELYEFDQDFEQARHQYRLAIELLDKDLAAKLSVPKSKSPLSAIAAILVGRELGGEHARLMIPWGVTRLRLMLQVGMTFEYVRDLERAEAEYRGARTLARALVRAYVDARGRGDEDISELGLSPPTASRLHTLKEMSLLFQPMFAEAWVAEKFAGVIDTSVTLVERRLWEIRRTLPFVRDPKVERLGEPEQGKPRDVGRAVLSHANFALTLSQLHNKAGDICFFKGRQPIKAAEIAELLGEDGKDQWTDGYLLRAHYHYAVGLHDLRRYIFQRVDRSEHWLSIASPGRRSQTLRAKALPDLLFRAAAGSVNDMAEATLARVSLFQLFTGLKNESEEWWRVPDLYKEFLEWLGTKDDALPTGERSLANWFGSWLSQHEYGEYDEAVTDLIEFHGPNPAAERLLMSLRLCLVGASFSAEGGYPEDAGRELLQVCETVTRYVWWARAVEWLPPLPLALPMSGLFTEGTAPGLWHELGDIAIEALTTADRLFLQSRYERKKSSPADELAQAPYRVGRTIPTSGLTLLCSLGLGGVSFLKEEQKASLRKLLADWTGRADGDFYKALCESMQRHCYPMINRLNGIKVLVDHLTLERRVPDFLQALAWTEELLDQNKQFDAPLHFTPLHSGITCALVWKWGQQLGKGEQLELNDRLERVRRAAQRDLQRSEEMYTMRRAYYEAINNLYYLYDDFNDRQIHFNHAIQMAGAELVAILKTQVGEAP